MEPDTLKYQNRAEEWEKDIVEALYPIVAEILEMHDLQTLDFKDLVFRKYGPEHYEFAMNIRLKPRWQER